MSEAKPCEVWKFWASSAWAAAAFAAWIAAQFALASVLIASLGFEQVADPERNILPVLFLALASAPAPIAVVVFAARRAGCTVTDYLALRPPRRGDLIFGLICIAILLPLGDVASYLTGRDVVPPFVIDAYKGARDGGMLVLLTLAFAVAAPVMEEFVFRGFLLPGYAASRIGPYGAMALTSAAWAAMHVQYEFFFVAQIFILGLVFGWLRWTSGSTLLTLILHALINLSALIQTAIIVEWLS